MKKLSTSYKLLFVLILAIAVYACGPKSSDESGDSTYIDTIEGASFKALLDDSRVNVSDFEGKVVLVDFWETWCVPCLQAMPTFQQVMEEYPDQFVVLAVSPGWSDTPEDIVKFRDEYEYPFVFVIDDTEVATKLEITGIPYKVFIGPDGEYISTELGAGGHQREYTKIVGVIEEAFGTAKSN